MTLSMDRWKGKVAIVTGASSGIGYATVKRLVEEGIKVAGLARRIERVEQMAKDLSGKRGKLLAVRCDLTKEEDILNAFKIVKQNLGPIHILINNAGVLHYTNLADGDTEKWRNIIDVNVIGLSIATREAIRDMKANNVDGHIVHINSITGHNVLPALPLKMYAASKFAVTALAESLRREFGQVGSKIKISSVSPGVVATEIFDAGGIALDLDKEPHLQSQDIAEGIVYVLSTPRHVQVTELTIRPVMDQL